MTQPAAEYRWLFWVAAAAAFLLFLWALNDVLLPFVVGAVVAYFFDPLVARLQRHGLRKDGDGVPRGRGEGDRGGGRVGVSGASVGGHRARLPAAQAHRAAETI